MIHVFRDEACKCYRKIFIFEIVQSNMSDFIISNQLYSFKSPISFNRRIFYTGYRQRTTDKKK